MKLKFSLETFWRLGAICFILIGLGNIYLLIYYWGALHTAAQFTKLVGIFFNFLLAYFFFWMLKGNKKGKKEMEKLKSNDEILKLFNGKEKEFFKK